MVLSRWHRCSSERARCIALALNLLVVTMRVVRNIGEGINLDKRPPCNPSIVQRKILSEQLIELEGSPLPGFVRRAPFTNIFSESCFPVETHLAPVRLSLKINDVHGKS